jgi:hypothetical protein
LGYDFHGFSLIIALLDSALLDNRDLNRESSALPRKLLLIVATIRLANFRIA